MSFLFNDVTSVVNFLNKTGEYFDPEKPSRYFEFVFPAGRPEVKGFVGKIKFLSTRMYCNLEELGTAIRKDNQWDEDSSNFRILDLHSHLIDLSRSRVGLTIKGSKLADEIQQAAQDLLALCSLCMEVIRLTKA